MSARSPNGTDPETAYHVWLGPARRNAAETARKLAIPDDTVRTWVLRYRWKDRAASEDRERRERHLSVALGILDGGLSYAAALARYGATGEWCYSPWDGPPPPRPDAAQCRMLTWYLALYGVAPTKRIVLASEDAPRPRVTAAELAPLLAAGDTRSLLALLSGKTPQDGPLPGDFASGQPGGRGVPEAPSVDTETIDAEFRDVDTGLPPRDDPSAPDDPAGPSPD